MSWPTGPSLMPNGIKMKQLPFCGRKSRLKYMPHSFPGSWPASPASPCRYLTPGITRALSAHRSFEGQGTPCRCLMSRCETHRRAEPPLAVIYCQYLTVYNELQHVGDAIAAAA